jgi:hypothetical protein
MKGNLNENGQEMVINMDNLGFNTPQPILITFTNPINGQHLGELKEVDGLLTFNGNIDESGKLFVDYICNLFNERIKQICDKK